MAQDTRKDPRAKVLSMTVRYKSATLDEFIEQHSHDVSRGGMFIKTPSPFPPGTLLKFEVKIAEDQKVMNGVGRVVWKREPPDAATDRPAGMGVKFIKIDEPAKRLIDRLLDQRGDAAAAFEAGEVAVGSSAPPARSPAAAAASSRAPALAATPSPPRIGTPAAPSAQPSGASPMTVATAAAAPAPARPARKATMMGLGGLESPSQPPSVPQKNDSPPPDEGFFPKTDSVGDMPAPEDRTVMKQAAELLQDALREAGGSMDEVGEASKEQPRDLPKEEDWADDRPTEKAPPPASALAELYAADKAANEKERSPQTEKPVSPEPIEAQPGEPKRLEEPEPVSRPARSREAATVPAAVTGSVEAGFEEQRSGGGGKVILLLLGVAAAAGLLFFLTRPAPEAAVETPPPPVTAPAVVKEPEPEPEPPPPEEPQLDAAVAAPEPAVEEKPAEPPPEQKKAPPPAPKRKPRAVKPKPPPPEPEPAEEPKTEQPKTEQPKTEQPKTEQPKTEQPKTEQPKETKPTPPPPDDNPY